MKYIYTLITDEEATNLHCNKNNMHSFLCFIFFSLWQIQCVKWFELLLGESMQWHGTLLAYRLSPWVPVGLQPDPLGRSSLQLFEGQSWSSQYRLGPFQGPPHSCYGWVRLCEDKKYFGLFPPTLAGVRVQPAPPSDPLLRRRAGREADLVHSGRAEVFDRQPQGDKNFWNVK